MQSAPLDYVTTPSGYQCMNPSIAQPVILRDPQFNNLSAKLDQVCCKLNKLDEIDARLKNYEESLGRVTRDVTDLKNNYGHIMDNVKSISDMFDDVTTNMKRELQEVSRQMYSSAKAVDEIDEIKSELRDVKESHIELQWRTMRDNLIFTGIAEDECRNPNGSGVTTEDLVNDFISDKLKIDPNTLIGFHRVHRMGRFVAGRRRPIVAKFVHYQDKEKVRLAAPEG
jgi:hypothetical protein